ncbi:hypothetical protein Pcinc_042074 [Petrolisthes cinctipes]|uniref:Reelin n=1 Tax=Petrolisthes cinctipes TaxID=88211 RepID=A0AAE1EGE5_PETCI|nr:hypothetical protein Pcinc_042074 [Petrolisthes cinctipes]
MQCTIKPHKEVSKDTIARVYRSHGSVVNVYTEEEEEGVGSSSGGGGVVLAVGEDGGQQDALKCNTWQTVYTYRVCVEQTTTTTSESSVLPEQNTSVWMIDKLQLLPWLPSQPQHFFQVGKCPGPDRESESIYVHYSCDGGVSWQLLHTLLPRLHKEPRFHLGKVGPTCGRDSALVFVDTIATHTTRFVETRSMGVGPSFMMQFDLVIGCGDPMLQDSPNKSSVCVHPPHPAVTPTTPGALSITRHNSPTGTESPLNYLNTLGRLQHV